MRKRLHSNVFWWFNIRNIGSVHDETVSWNRNLDNE